LINNLSFVVEAYATGSSDRNHELDEDACDPIFAPLETWELPEQSQAGSGAVLKKPLQHLFQYVQRSFSAPSPLGRHPTGIRQTLLPPPAQRPSPYPARPAKRGAPSLSTSSVLFGNGAGSSRGFRWSLTRSPMQLPMPTDKKETPETDSDGVREEGSVPDVPEQRSGTDEEAASSV
jgi:hypothetical protein